MLQKVVAIFIFLLSGSFLFPSLVLVQVGITNSPQPPGLTNTPEPDGYPFEYGLRPDRPGAPNITKCNSLPNCLLWFFTIMFRTMIWLAGVFAVVMIILAGLAYMTKPDDAKNIHSRLYWAALGLIVALLAFGLVQFIEFNLTKKISFVNFAYAARALPPPALATSPLDDFEPPERLGGVPGCDAVSIFKFLPGDGQRNQDIPVDLWKNCVLSFLGNKILPLIYTISLLFSVGVILWTGLEYVQSGGNVSNVHNRLIWAIVGIIVTVLAFSLVKAIELSLSIPSTQPGQQRP